MLKTTFEGVEVIHRVLWHIVTEQTKEAEVRQEGWFHPSIVARVFAYHTVEAYLNYVGERIAPDIWADEWNFFRKEPYRGALGKLKKVMDLVGLPWDENARPLSTVLTLKQIRDLIAHGKPEKMTGSVVHPMDTFAPYPESQLRGFAKTKEELPIVLSDVEAFLDSIQVRAKPLLKFNDVWFGNSALKGPPSYSSSLTTLNQ